MTCIISYLVYLSVTTALALGSEVFNKPQTEQGNPHDVIQVVLNEHLFMAGNDSSGTAAITFTSRLNPSGAPTINRFINYSFPYSCTSHPTRCRELTYMSSRDNATNHTRMIFYIPLMGPDSAAALGLMEFWHDGEKILQNITTRIIGLNSGQCDPVSVMRIPNIGVYLICASDDLFGSLMLCQVGNRNNISTAELRCTEPHSLNQPQSGLLANLALLSNFVIDTSGLHFDLYFVYKNILYHRNRYGTIEGILNFQTFHCHHIHLAPVNRSFLIGHCYKDDRVEAFYFNLDTYQYVIISRGDVTIAHYHCPDPQQFITISVSSQSRVTRASYQDGGVNRGSFNIMNASQVIFAKCFTSRNQTHFIYQDSELGVFIKPNISVDLLSSLVRVSDLHDQPCKQPLIFNNRYLVLTYNVDNTHGQEIEVFDLYEDLNRTSLTLVSDSASQIAFFPEFTKRVLVQINGTQTTTFPPKKIVRAYVHHIVGACVAVFILFSLLGVISLVVVLLIRHKYCKKKGEERCCRQYAPVAGNEETKLKDTKKAHETGTCERQTTRLLSKEDSSSPTPPPPEEPVTLNAQRTPDTNIDPPESCVVANPDTLPTHSGEGNIISPGHDQGVNVSPEESAPEDLPRQRSQCSTTEGASQDDIPALQCTQPSIRTHTAGCEPIVRRNMDPIVPRSPPRNFQSCYYGMPLLECNESPTTSTSIANATQFNSRLCDTTGACTVQLERPRPGFDRQSSLPNPPRPHTLVPPQAQQRRLDHGQSPQLHHPNYSTSNTSLTPDNDLEYQRQQVQQQQRRQPITARMNNSDSTNSAHSQTSATSTHAPPVSVSHSLPPHEHAYYHASPPQSHRSMHNTVPPMNPSTRESANSVTSLTPESRPESGHQTGSMLVTGTNYH